jgi:CelD/BcsL family acetyltransferase involved in cellulose biosynthesis
MWVKGELFDDFDAAEQSARGELDRASQPNLFDRLAWFKMLWKHCPPGRAPLIARARAEQTDLWLFLARTEEGQAIALANWYTLSFRPIFSGDAPDSTKKALLVAIARRLASGLATLTLSPVPNGDGTADLIASAFRKAGWIVTLTAKTGNWTADVSDKTFESFWAGRPGQVRSTLDRKSKKFAITTKIHTKYTDAAWEDYEEVYAGSWKGDEGSPEFIRDMIRTEGKAGTLRLGIASFEGRAIAAQLWTVENGTAIIHKLAYREDAKEMSPGTILSAAMFRNAIDSDHVNLIDYGTGDDGYKADWMDGRNALFTISMHNPRRLTGLIGAAKAGLSSLLGRN